MIGTVLTWIIDTLLSPLFWFWDQAGIIPWVIGGFVLMLIFKLLGMSTGGKLDEDRLTKDVNQASQDIYWNMK